MIGKQDSVNAALARRSRVRELAVWGVAMMAVALAVYGFTRHPPVAPSPGTVVRMRVPVPPGQRLSRSAASMASGSWIAR